MIKLNFSVGSAIAAVSKRMGPQGNPQLEPLKQYNLKVQCFHVGVAMMTAAVALAIFTKFAAACAIGFIGWGLYTLMSREFAKLERPLPGMMNRIRENAPKANILARLGVHAEATVWARGWMPVQIAVEGKPIVRAMIPSERVVFADRLPEDVEGENLALEHMLDVANRLGHQLQNLAQAGRGAQ